MLYIKLSDHLVNQRQANKTQQEKRFLDELTAYARGTEDRASIFSELDHTASQALSQRKYFTWARTQCRLMQHFFQARPQAPAPLTVERDVEKWAAATEGVHRVREHLAWQLDDRYVLISGYLSAQGQIDLLLLGPSGLFAMEIQFVHGPVRCNGDIWTKRVPNESANRVQVDVPLADQYGQSPSQRINKPAYQLQAHLQSNFQSESGSVTMRRVVIFCHDQSSLGELYKPTVDFVTVLKNWDLVPFVTAANPEARTLSIAEIATLSYLVQHDHWQHNPQGPMPTPPVLKPTQKRGQGVDAGARPKDFKNRSRKNVRRSKYSVAHKRQYVQ